MSDAATPTSEAAVEIDGYALPADLVALQRDFFATHDRCQALAADLPSAADLVAFDTTPDDARHTEFNKARAERLRLVETLQSHPWWTTVDNRFNAQRALYRAVE